ncbi:MAG: EVE domain-containing protein, partial [Chitinophagaceae bacterium]
IAKVAKEFYQDPTTEDKNWVVIDLIPWKALKVPVTLHQIKSEKRLANMQLLRLGRISVTAVTAEEWRIILELSRQK